MFQARDKYFLANVTYKLVPIGKLFSTVSKKDERLLFNENPGSHDNEDYAN